MRIAITGATGFIGRWLIDEAGKKNDLIIIGIQEEKEILKNNKNILHYFITDYSVESLTEILSENIEGIIHLAAQRPASKSSDKSYTDYSLNIKLAFNVFEACRKTNISNIVFTSSISVYGSSIKLPFTENILPQPNGLYGLAKLSIDNLADFYNRKHHMTIKSLRLAHVFGLGEKEGFMFMIFVNKAKNNEKLTIFGRGEGRREYIYVKDVVSALLNAIQKKTVSGIFNIGTGINTSHLELAKTINEVFDNKDNIDFKDYKNEDKSVDLMNVEKAHSSLNWQNRYSLKEALDDMKLIIEN